MKPTFKWGRMSAMVAGVMLALSFGTAAHANEASVTHLLAQKYPALKNVKAVALPIAGMYEVAIAGNIAYTDEKVDYLLVGGELLSGDGASVRNVTQERAAAQAKAAVPAPPVVAAAPVAPPVTPSSAPTGPVPAGMIAEPTLAQVSGTGASPHGTLKVVKKESDVYDNLPFDKAIPIVYGKGERKLAMFADPDCPYCQRMEGTLNGQGAALNATVYVFLWPLSIHPHSNEKADYLWCQPDRAQAWTSWMVYADRMNTVNPNADEEDVWKSWKTVNHRPMTNTCSAPSPREEIRGIAQKYGMRYTPTLIFENGAAVSGGADINGLTKGWDYVYRGLVSKD